MAAITEKLGQQQQFLAEIFMRPQHASTTTGQQQKIKEGN